MITPVPTVSETETPCREIGNLPPSGGREVKLAITPMWWIMWGVFLASATMPATMRAGIGLIVLTAGLLAPAPIIRYTRETGKRRGRPASKEWNPT